MTGEQLLRRLLELAGADDDARYVLARAGEGLEAVPATLEVAGRRYQVARPATELGLRRLLWQSGGAPCIAIIGADLAGRLPADLLRAAHGGRVHALGPAQVLAAVLGTHVMGVEDEPTLQLALEHLEALRRLLREDAGTPTVLDSRLLDELLAEVSVGRRLGAVGPGALLALLLERATAWDERLRAVWQRYLRRRLATEGRLLAWALDGQDRLAALLLHGLLLASDDAHPSPLTWGPLDSTATQEQLGITRDLLRPTLVRLALDCLDAMDAMGLDSAAWLTQAETKGRGILALPILEQSAILPLGLDAQARTLAMQAAAGRPVAARAVEALRRHRAARLRQRDLTVLDELARLSRYLAAPEATRLASVLNRAPDAFRSATAADRMVAYQRDGAFADLVALRLRRAAGESSAFAPQVVALLAAWRVRRDTENEAFALLLAEDYERAVHSPGLIPVQGLWRELVLPALEAAALEQRGKAGVKAGTTVGGTAGVAAAVTAGVFVVVLDGCSYPVFLDLLYRLTQDPELPCGLALPAAADGALSDEARPRPGLALLPSVTSHSRGALFLGSVPKDPWVDERLWPGEREAVTDQARFRQNQDLSRRGLPRRLFLKGDLARGGALEAALGDEHLPVVAAVFNAVDDEIGSSNTGAVSRLRPGDISGFLSALGAAFDAGRAVFLTADHGHTPFLGTALRVGAGPTPRFCELAESEQQPEGFAVIDTAGLGGPAAAQGKRLAFAWRVGAYRGQPQVGFHGGCGLEELVVPMARLCRHGVPASEPGWWFGGGGVEEEG